MRDDLIGFVLGALDSSEQEQLRRKIARDPDLQHQVKLIRHGLKPLSVATADVEPPAGLAERTCQFVWAVAEAGIEEAETSVEEGRPTSPQADRFDPWDSAAAGDDGDLSVGKDPGQAKHSALEPAGSVRSTWGGQRSWGSETIGAERTWTLPDFFVAAGVCLAAACLFFPALLNSRWHSQLASCQNNMHQLGVAMIDFSDGDGHFPPIPASGNGSVAGIYAPQLVERGLVKDDRTFLCPAKGSTVVLKIPRMQDILSAKGPSLVTLHRTMGGDYAYHLGFVDQGRLRSVRNRGRTHFAILSDAPLENVRNVAIGTHGRGQNVLFEDGHVKFLTTRLRPGSEDDDLFYNDRGVVRAGLHPQDCVLAPSGVSPLPQSH